jgi:hypothetical protein
VKRILEADIIPKTQRKIEILWDRDDPKSVTEAQERFLRLSRRGWVAFATLSDGRRVHVTSFDASLERITLLMPMEGG